MSNFNNQRDDRPSNKTITVPMVLDGKTDRGEAYNANDLMDILAELARIEVTKLISIPVYGMRKDILDKDAKGTMSIGFLKSIDLDHETLGVVIYPKYADMFNDNSSAKFRVILDRKENYVRQILGIDIVNI